MYFLTLCSEPDQEIVLGKCLIVHKAMTARELQPDHIDFANRQARILDRVISEACILLSSAIG